MRSAREEGRGSEDGSFRRIFNMCVGLFGVQIVWGLHNVNTSRIFQTFGADLEQLAFLWIAAPASGLLVQPIVGFLSDRTWNRLGRRRPYMLAGTVLSAAALLLMPNVHSIWAASVMLWLLIAAINIVMEPFRALLADSVPPSRRTFGFALQVFFIGGGAVFATGLPWLLSEGMGVSGQAAAGELPDTIRWAFYLGAGVLLASVAWTVATTREPTPADLAHQPRAPTSVGRTSPAALRRASCRWIGGGVAVALLAWVGQEIRELYVLAAIALGYGLLQAATSRRLRRGQPLGMLEIVEDVVVMPPVLRRLAVVQFFTWFGLFAMWIYTVPAVAALHFGTMQAMSAGYAAAGDRVSLLFAQYNGISALVALLLPAAAKRIGRRLLYAVSLCAGAAGLASIVLLSDVRWLLLAACGIGIAWSAVLAMPYAILADALPPDKRGVYMGIHNIFLVLPQLAAASVLGLIVQRVFGGSAAAPLVLAAGCLAMAALCTAAIPRVRPAPAVPD